MPSHGKIAHRATCDLVIREPDAIFEDLEGTSRAHCWVAIGNTMIRGTVTNTDGLGRVCSLPGNEDEE